MLRFRGSKWKEPVASIKRLRARDGFALSELLAVIAVLAILTSAATPWVLSGLPGARLAWGAREIQSALHRAKMLAISTRQSVCVQPVPGGYQFLQGGCAGAVWKGQGTDSAGIFHPANDIMVTNSGANPVFTPFGNASQGGTLTVRTQAGNRQTVTVSAIGSITIP